MLAKRRIVLFDPEVLRRLDRVDCLVLQGDLLPKERFVVADIVSAGDEQTEELEERIASLFDSEAPLEVRRDGAWPLGPLRLLNATVTDSLENRARELASRGAIVLGLAEDGPWSPRSSTSRSRLRRASRSSSPRLTTLRCTS